MIDSNNQLKTLSKSLLNAVRGVMEAKSHTVPKTDKEKKLAALAEPKDKITHADVLKGRGVTKEDVEQVDEMSSKMKMKLGLYGKKKKMDEAEVPGVVAGSMEGEKHMCATKVFHKEWNEGTPIKTMHADPDANGLIEWYDVMFEHGIERVMTEDMEVLQQESHMHSKKKMKEEVEAIDELSQDKLMDYRAAAKKQGTGIQDKMKVGGGDWSKDGKDTDTLKKRMAGYKMAGRKVNPGLAANAGKAPRVAATEEVEVIDEALDAAARYGQHHVAIKELMKSISQHVESHKSDALKHRDYRGKKGVHWGHVGDVAQIHSQLADIHDRLAQQGEYKKSMAESVEDLDIEQIDELSTKTLKSYRAAARNDAYDAADVDDEPRFRKRAAGSNTAGKKLVKRGESLKTEDIELDEARGRPRKNPLPIADVEPEPRQHIIQQLQRAKLSMRGGEDVTFKNGKKGHVSGPHASKILSRYAGMRPAEKEDFQKKIGASHEAFKQHL